MIFPALGAGQLALAHFRQLGELYLATAPKGEGSLKRPLTASSGMIR